MKQLIISIYDSWVYCSVLSNGKYNHKLENEIYNLYYSDGSFKKLLLNKYCKLYDSIIVCEDGDIEVIK